MEWKYPVIYLRAQRKFSTKGAKKGVSNVYGGHEGKILGAENGPSVELWGDLRPGQGSGNSERNTRKSMSCNIGQLTPNGILEVNSNLSTGCFAVC
eukprot:1160125-Pelagomonas_calceolata.AAC.5